MSFVKRIEKKGLWEAARGMRVRVRRRRTGRGPLQGRYADWARVVCRGGASPLSRWSRTRTRYSRVSVFVSSIPWRLKDAGAEYYIKRGFEIFMVQFYLKISGELRA